MSLITIDRYFSWSSLSFLIYSIKNSFKKLSLSPTLSHSSHKQLCLNSTSLIWLDKGQSKHYVKTFLELMPFKSFYIVHCIEGLKIFNFDPQLLKFWLYCSVNYVSLIKHLWKNVERHNSHHQGIPLTSSTLPLPMVCKCISCYINFHFARSDKFECSQY